MGFLDANGITRLVTDLGNIFEYKLSNASYNTSTTPTTYTAGTMTGQDKEKVDMLNTRVVGNGGTIPLTTGTSWQNVDSITLTSGQWIINANVVFASNATGRRAICFSGTSVGGQTGFDVLDIRPAVDGSYTTCRFTVIGNIENDGTYYINAYQDSGSTLNAYPRIRCAKIGPYVSSS